MEELGSALGSLLTKTVSPLRREALSSPKTISVLGREISQQLQQ
jgi:hypothetical protein